MKELDGFTVEQLNDFIKSDHTQCGDVAALARIALAAKRAEPIYQYHTGIINEEGDIDWYWVDCDKGFYSQYDNQHRRIVYTTPQLNSPEMLEGWKLVPIEITKAMRDAWDSAPNGHEDDDVNMCNAYRAMIAAAPEPQTQQQNIPEIIPQGWTSSDPANAALVMLDRIDTIDSADDDRIEDIKLIIRQLAAAPEKPL
ncbi:hypothetical protein FG426_004456 [Yersinia enterocolitica]|uniref:hypothetical protein n=1 Tax=Yersinia enterocolitica TaxID=630 RepID=UPI0027E6816D|nr:hypothetical protein [Yersinia enterocolitica]EKN4841067.1 hypothetical protein [Yersinia enterocolitica]ELI8005626.1 hypothetical protein [Yersinia enterocolitica]HDU2654207.1 hypothetical protein [Yersinia enterocolitica]HEM8997868.1 hypothetical protein [Yersinia enterocolitica]